MVCQKCEVTPAPITGIRSYFIWPPIGHSGSKIRRVLTGLDTAFSLDDDCKAVRFDAPVEDFKHMAVALTGALSAEERRTTMVLVKEPGSRPTAADIPAARSFEAVASLVDAGWLLSMVDDKRLDISLSPVVHAEEWEDVFALSASLHGVDADGNKIGAEQIYQTATNACILAPVDRSARVTAIETIGRSGIGLPTFIPFSPSSIYDPEFCLRTTVASVKEAGIDPSMIIFTVLMTGNLPDTDHLRGILRYYRNAGFQVALSDMGAGGASLDLLSQVKPDMIRISSKVATGAADDPYKSVVVRKLLEMAQRLRIDTIACGVADEADALFLYEHGTNFLEGPLVADGKAPR